MTPTIQKPLDEEDTKPIGKTILSIAERRAVTEEISWALLATASALERLYETAADGKAAILSAASPETGGRNREERAPVILRIACNRHEQAARPTSQTSVMNVDVQICVQLPGRPHGKKIAVRAVCTPDGDVTALPTQD